MASFIHHRLYIAQIKSDQSDPQYSVIYIDRSGQKYLRFIHYLHELQQTTCAWRGGGSVWHSSCVHAFRVESVRYVRLFLYSSRTRKTGFRWCTSVDRVLPLVVLVRYWWSRNCDQRRGLSTLPCDGDGGDFSADRWCRSFFLATRLRGGGRAKVTSARCSSKRGGGHVYTMHDFFMVQNIRAAIEVHTRYIIITFLPNYFWLLLAITDYYWLLLTVSIPLDRGTTQYE